MYCAELDAVGHLRGSTRSCTWPRRRGGGQTVLVIVGIGADAVDVPRFAAALARTPRLRPRLFTDAEQVLPSGMPRSDHSLAARFAAKVAAAKALGVPRGSSWRDAEVLSGPHGQPLLRVTGWLSAAAAEAGVTTWHLSLTHDADFAAAFVIVEAG